MRVVGLGRNRTDGPNYKPDMHPLTCLLCTVMAPQLDTAIVPDHTYYHGNKEFRSKNWPDASLAQHLRSARLIKHRNISGGIRGTIEPKEIRNWASNIEAQLPTKSCLDVRVASQLLRRPATGNTIDVRRVSLGRAIALLQLQTGLICNRKRNATTRE